MNKIRIGITGSYGFIGSHLLERLKREKDISIVSFEKGYFENKVKIRDFVKDCDVVVHLAAKNRGSDDEVYNFNVYCVQTLVLAMEEMDVKPHVIFSSSTQSMLDNPYGRSKKKGCEILKKWSMRNNAPVSLLTIPNVFGDRCKPFYNSVVATFCYQLTHGEQPEIIEDSEIELIYINELIEYIYNVIKNPPNGIEEHRIPGSSKIKVSRLLYILEGFKDLYFMKKTIPFLVDPFLINLYNVFLSYVDKRDLCYSPEIHSDQRGELFEVLRLLQGGQIFFSVTKPGAVRGNHYHTRKIERFCILKGEAMVWIRRIGEKEVTEYRIDDDKPKFIDIPIFHTHNIKNVGKEDLYTLFWCNELFNPDDPDTFFEEV